MGEQWTRRRVLQAGVCAALAGSQGAWALDRVKAGERYRAWLVQLTSDVATVAREAPREELITLAQIHQFCSASIVPNSRAAGNFMSWLNQSRQHGERTVSGEIVFVGPLTIILRLLEASMPAGRGGLFPESQDSGFPDRSLEVWYMHVHAGEHLQRYFDDKQIFKPYHLPPEGQLVRDAYPFLMFDDQGPVPRLGGFGREWFGAVDVTYNMQFQ
jgi:hypothetical protein